MRLLLCTLLACGPLVLGPAVAVSATDAGTVDIHEIETNRAADRALKQTEALATSISFAFDYLATFIGETGPPPIIVQAELQASAARLNGVRSILVVGENGIILHDALARPPPTINLSNRRYFQTALETPGLHFGQTIVGRTSGFPFAPISTHKPAMNAVFTAIVNLRAMREPLDWCLALCGGAILTDNGTLIAASPSELIIPQEVIDRIVESEAKRDLISVTQEHFTMLIAFRKSERFRVTVLTIRFIAPTENLTVQ